MFTNCHTHIFNIRCAPNGFAGIKIAKRFSRAPWLPRGIAFALRRVLPGRRDKLEKLANFLKIGISKRQSDVFKALASHYRSDDRFVVLTMDMHHMGAGPSEIDFMSQIFQVRELKLEQRERMIPFLGVDPRRLRGKELRDFVAKYIERYGFGGIKLYTPLGFYPFDPGLDDLYAYAQDMQIPIMSHCSQGGIYFQNEVITEEQIRPNDLDGKKAIRYRMDENGNLHEAGFHDYISMAPDLKYFLGIRRGKNRRNKKFSLNFSNPINYINVLEKYPRLKLCLAHFGGDGQIEEYLDSPTDDNWHLVVRRLMRRYEHVYSDVSYALWNKKAWYPIRETINDEEIGSKVLFGTDYYMTLQEKGEGRLVRDFRRSLTQKEFEKISIENPQSYLKMRFNENR
jgi:predicted TIM-barrel fold metal-dependent hydrolase